MKHGRSNFPDKGYEKYFDTEITSPISHHHCQPDRPRAERTMARVARDLQDALEGVDAVLEAGFWRGGP